MANEEFYTTLIALVLLVIVAVIAVRSCSSGTSYFGSTLDTYAITLTTNKSYAGINSLVNELTNMQKTNILYVVKDNKTMLLQVKSLTNRRLKDNDVLVEDSMGFSRKYTNRGSKNAIWNTDQSASVRAPAFLTLFSIQSMKMPASYMNGCSYTYTKGMMSYYIISKNPSLQLVSLVDRLNSESASYGFKNVTFSACLDKSLPENVVEINYGDSPKAVIKKKYNDVDWNADMLGSFLDTTGIFPELKAELEASRECKFSKNVSPPTPDVCDEKTNHCYMLRAYSKGSQCTPTEQHLNALTDAYNRAVSRAGVVHRTNKKPVRFYGVHLPGSNDKIVSSIDRSSMQISENVVDVERAMQRNNFKQIESHVVDYLTIGGGGRMSAGPQEYM